MFPSVCLNCQLKIDGKEAICGKCQSGIELNSSLFCGKCRARMANNKKICHRDFPYTLGAASNYDNEVVKKLIYGLKFKSIRSAGLILGEILADYATTINPIWKNFLVIPIPLGRRRERKRGYNQAEIIAKIISEKLKLPLQSEIVYRTKETLPQSETKKAAEREKNVQGCFKVRKPELIIGRNVILIDDVITSGATINEAARILKESGAKRIVALVVAKV